jgi:hypothetical protein
MIRTQPRLRNAVARVATLTLLAPALAAALICGSAQAADMKALADEFWEAASGGKIHLNMRARYEYADLSQGSGTNTDPSNAFTLRTRLGYGTAAFRGFSAYADFDYVAAVDPSKHYFDTVSTPNNGKSPIADPRVIELNQAYLKAETDAGKGSSTIVGRQRIILDDHRFIGNVGWRQNEQTYDSWSAKSRLGVEDLEAFYAYVWEVRRIFGGQTDLSQATGNFASNSHLMNVSYAGLPAKLTGFIYLLDLDISNLPASRRASSATFGFRANGKHKLGDELSLGYAASYAYQTDFRRNPVSYGANYLWISGELGLESLGSVGAGFEYLGSDSGNAQFLTPLATLHKFNGWADVFLDNGGVGGLQDLNFTVAPKLPWKLGGKIVYHYFWGADSGNQLGDEWDVLLKRPINKYVDVLAKYAYFRSAVGSPRPDVQRVWVQATVKF